MKKMIRYVAFNVDIAKQVIIHLDKKIPNVGYTKIKIIILEEERRHKHDRTGPMTVLRNIRQKIAECIGRLSDRLRVYER